MSKPGGNCRPACLCRSGVELQAFDHFIRILSVSAKGDSDQREVVDTYGFDRGSIRFIMTRPEQLVGEQGDVDLTPPCPVEGCA